MKKIILFSTLAIFLAFAFIPMHVMAQDAPRLDYSGFVNCDGVVKKSEQFRQTKCDFEALMATINKMINWMFYISIPAAGVLFSYAGLLYIRGTSNSRSQANKIFTSVGIGFIIMLVAWIGVRTAVDWLVEKNSGATTFLGK